MIGKSFKLFTFFICILFSTNLVTAQTSFNEKSPERFAVIKEFYKLYNANDITRMMKCMEYEPYYATRIRKEYTDLRSMMKLHLIKIIDEDFIGNQGCYIVEIHMENLETNERRKTKHGIIVKKSNNKWKITNMEWL